MSKKSRNKPQQEILSFLSHLRSSFGPRQKEIAAILLLVLAILTLLGLGGVTAGSLVDAWTLFLQRSFGLGAWPLTLFFAGLGAWLLLRTVNQVSPLRWKSVVGFQIAFLLTLALIHQLAPGDDPLALAQKGLGGGYIGWAITDLLQRTMGDLIAFLLLLTGLALGLALSFDWTLEDLTAAFLTLADRLRKVGPDPAPTVESRAAKRVPAPRRQQPPIPEAPPAPTEPEPKPVVKPQPSRPHKKAGPTPDSQPRTRRRAVRLPPLDLLIADENDTYGDADNRYRTEVIEKTLESFGVPVKVVDAKVGPVVTQFELEPLFTEYRASDGEIHKRKVRVSKISALSKDLALALAASPIRIQAPVPGRSVVGVEVPNSQVALVGLRDVMESTVYKKKRSRLKIALGRNVAGNPVVTNLATMPHLLIAGATGSGKSVCINTITVCLAFNNRPQDLQMVMIDPKMVELSRFNGLPHLLGPVETDLKRIGGVLYWTTKEMESRYEKFAAATARHLDDYNSKVSAHERLPRIVILIDELADLMLNSPDETERTITRLAQMARATGIHLVVATQRPSVDVVTGLIKANFPSRISFAVTSQVDSRVILDQPGAETLLGQGDMLYMASDSSKLVRVQGCFVSDKEIKDLIKYWDEQIPPHGRDKEPPWDKAVIIPDQDSLLEEAIELVRETGAASASFLQRKMRIGYPRASRIIEQMEELGVIGPPESGGRRRKVLLEADSEAIQPGTEDKE